MKVLILISNEVHQMKAITNGNSANFDFILRFSEGGNFLVIDKLSDLILLFFRCKYYNL